MTVSTKISLLSARLLLGLLFVIAGLGKLSGVEGFAAYMASGGVPAALAWPVILFEILGGLALIAGIRTREVALALGAFCVASGVLFHFDPTDQMQMTSFLKNLALAGGFVALAVAGPGRVSVDGWKGTRAVAG